MNLLAIDTSTDTLSVAVQRGEGGDGVAAQVFVHTSPGGALASSGLIPAIQDLMRQAGLGFAQLDAIAFGAGPGSFTGLRTACSVAQGLAFGVGVPVLPIDTLLAVAEEARFQGGGKPVKILALLDARMNELYACCYEYRNGAWSQNGGMGLIRPENMLSGGVPPLASDLDCLLAGNVFAAYAASLPASQHRRLHTLPTATAMLRLAPALLAAGGAVKADQALPIYIRDKVAETTEERLQKRLAAQSATQPASQPAQAKAPA